MCLPLQVQFDLIYSECESEDVACASSMLSGEMIYLNMQGVCHYVDVAGMEVFRLSSVFGVLAIASGILYEAFFGALIGRCLTRC